MLKLMKRLWLQSRIRSTEIHLTDLRTAKTHVQDIVTSTGLALRIANIEEELTRLRVKYNASLPAGQRRTWSVI